MENCSPETKKEAMPHLQALKEVLDSEGVDLMEFVKEYGMKDMAMNEDEDSMEDSEYDDSQESEGAMGDSGKNAKMIVAIMKRKKAV